MTTQVRKNVMDMFIDGARRGFTIATTRLAQTPTPPPILITAASSTVADSPGSPHSAITGSHTRPTISSSPVTFSA